MKPSVKKPINRREFIEMTGKGAAVAGMASLPMIHGCSSDDTKSVYGACYHDCPDRCAWKVTVADGRIRKFEADPAHPFTAGKLCDKMADFPNDVTFHPDRILTPLKRVGKKGEGKFEPISWDKAIAEVASRLKTIIEQKGGEAILPFSFGGNQGIVHGGALAEPFFAHAGASNLQRTICGSAAVEGVMATNGQTTGVLPEDIVHSRYIVLWGTNTIQSNEHLWPFIQRAKDRGARVVVIDPFASQTAAMADWHIQPNPGTDTALALGLINALLTEGLQDREYIGNYTSGIDELTEHVEPYTPEKVATITGLEADTIHQLAREYATSKPSLIRVLIGLEHQANGSSAFRAIAMLPAITGAWRNYGGGLMHMTYEFAGQALNWSAVTPPPEPAGKPRRSINMVQLGRALTNPSTAPGVDALIVFNANPAVTIPNQNLVRQGLGREDLLTVVLEHFITGTARYADYVFPATTVFEHWDLMDSWGTPYLHLNEPAMEPRGKSKTNGDFFRLLARAMNFNDPIFKKSDLDIIKETLDSDNDLLKEITFNSLRKTGWAKFNVEKNWMPHAAGNFRTQSGKCMLYNPDEDPSLPDYIAPLQADDNAGQFPLQLMSVKSPKYFLNSSHANVGHLIEKEGAPCLDITAEDASARHIADGDELRVFNQRGSVILTARIGKKVRQGVVCMPQGFWPSLMKGGSSANALTDDRLTDKGGGAAIHEARVQVEKV